MKIVYCINSVYLSGGMERITLVKANALARIPGNEVWVVVTDAQQEPVIPLQGTHLVDLGVKYFEVTNGIMGILKKKRLHKKLLQRYLNEIKPDVVNAVGGCEKGVVPLLKVYPKPVLIRELHLERHYRFRKQIKNIKEWLYAWGGDQYDYHWVMKKYDHIVLLTNEDRQRYWQGWKNVSVIPNPITSQFDRKSNCDVKKAIAVGRLTHQKNFSALIRIWRTVAVHHPDWQLEIWGEGELQRAIQQQIEEAGLEDGIFLRGYTSEALRKMSQASMYLLSSYYEGLPLVMIEAMSVGLPVVSFMCPTGPQDILDDGRTGYLVPVGEENLFAEKVCRLIEDESLRKTMGEAALEESGKYRVDTIIPLWMNLFQELLDKKKR